MSQKLILEQFFPYQLVNLAQRVSTNLAQTYQEQFGLSIPEWRVLACLGERERATAKTIAASSFMDKVKTSRAIRELSKKGLLNKEQDKNDSRACWLSLNRRGKQLYNNVVPYAVAWEEGLLGSLSDADHRRLMKIFAKLNGYLDELE